MRRREFIGLLATITVCPQTALGQVVKKRPVIARLALTTKDAPLIVRYVNQFLTGMRELGYTEGRDFEMAYRYADFHAERLPGLAAELVQLNPDVILAGATIDAVALKQATDNIGSAYETLSASGVEVVVVEQSSMLVNARSEVAAAAAARMLPTVYGYREHVEAGGLISYGVNLDWCFHRTAYYVDKILKGAKPSELPLELPTNLQLVINLKTAKALKLDIPRALLDRADEVIE
jgi:ABC-type uncharacterized transport system substrate-binding protein